MANRICFFSFWRLDFVGGVNPRIFSSAIDSGAKVRAEVTSKLDNRSIAYREALAQAEAEVEESNQEQGIWAQALVKSGGDETKRKVAYMELRAKQLNLKAKGNEYPHASDK